MFNVFLKKKCQQDENPHWSADDVKKFNAHALFTFESWPSQIDC